MGSGFSKKGKGGGEAKEDDDAPAPLPGGAASNTVDRVRRIEHRRRSSLASASVDVEKLIASNQKNMGRQYRPTMVPGKQGEVEVEDTTEDPIPPASTVTDQALAALEIVPTRSAIKGSQDSITKKKKKKGIKFNEKENKQFTRAMTTQRDKPHLHYSRDELFQMQKEAEEEEDMFTIVAVKLDQKGSGIVYGVRWLDEEAQVSSSQIDWIPRDQLLEAGPTLLAEYEVNHYSELTRLNAKLKEALIKNGTYNAADHY